MATLKVSSSVPSPSEDAEQLKSAFDGIQCFCLFLFLLVFWTVLYKPDQYSLTLKDDEYTVSI